jgi:hypothetical protein
MPLQLKCNECRWFYMTRQAVLESISPYLVLGQADDASRSFVETAHVLHDLIVTFDPQGHFSVRTIEDECGPAIHCAFERKVDADRLAATVGAIDIIRYEGYRSERAFYLNDATLSKVRRLLERRR